MTVMMVVGGGHGSVCLTDLKKIETMTRLMVFAILF